MKKIVTLLLAVLMFASAFVLASCGNKDNPEFTSKIEPTSASEPISEPTTSVEPTTATEMVPPHVHVYSNLKSDESGHWYECPEDGARAEVEEHIWDDGVVIAEATYTEGGEIKYTCIICGEIMVEKTDPKEIVPGYVEVKRTLDQWGYTDIYYDVTIPSGEVKTLVIGLPKGDYTDGSTPVIQYSISKYNMCNVEWSENTLKSDFIVSYPKFYMDGVLVAQYDLPTWGSFGFGNNVDYDGEKPKAGERHTITVVAELIDKPVDLGSSFSSDDFKGASKVGITFIYEVILEIVK